MQAVRTSALNQNVGAYSIAPSGVAMERRTLRWHTDLAGYDKGDGGNLTSGGMMDNFTGLKLARDGLRALPADESFALRLDALEIKSS